MATCFCMEYHLNVLEENRMNKNEFITEAAKRCNVSTYEIEESLNVMANIVAEKLIAGENVEFPKLGIFHIVKRNRMTGKNLFGEPERQLDACAYPSFKIVRQLKTRVKNGCKHCQKL